MAPHGFGQIEVDQGIAAEHHEGLIKEGLEGLNFLQATGRSQGIANQLTVFDAAFKAVGNFHAKALAVSEIVLDFLGQVRHIHHDFGEAVLAQKFQQKLHHRLLQDRDHRFGDRLRNWTHTGSLTGRQDHRLHRRCLPWK